MNIAFEELEGSPQLKILGGELTGQRIFKVAWADRMAAVAELWGSYQVLGNQLAFRQPAQFPDVPNLIVHDLRIEPLDPRSPLGNTVLRDFSHGANSYAHARITVGYQSFADEESSIRKPKVPKGTLLTFSADLSAEYLTLPGRHWNWNIAGNPAMADDMAPGILVPCEELQLAWRRVPRPPWSALRALRGTINSAPFMDHAPGTVLFLGGRARRDFQIVDSGLWRLDYHFKVRAVRSTVDGETPLGWNHFYRQLASGGEHWLPIHDADGNPPYQSTDFAPLFSFGS